MKPFIVTAHYPLQGHESDTTTQRQDKVTSIQMDLYCKGPTTAGFYMKSNFYTIFTETPEAVYAASDAAAAENMGGHAATLIGWGKTDANLKYWELMNSWGSDWGNGGFFRIERGVDCCRIESLNVHAGDVEATNGSWMYEDWGACDAITDKKKRGLKC